MELHECIRGTVSAGEEYQKAIRDSDLESHIGHAQGFVESWESFD